MAKIKWLPNSVSLISFNNRNYSIHNFSVLCVELQECIVLVFLIAVKVLQAIRIIIAILCNYAPTVGNINLIKHFTGGGLIVAGFV